MQRLFAGVSIAALLIAAPLAASAQDQDTDVEAIVSTGTFQLEGIAAGKIGGSLTILTAEDIEDRQVRLISDVLRDVPGLAVSRAGGPGSLTAVRIRGAEGNHTLVLIDGIEASDPFQGEFDFASLGADEAGRVEVLRGQQSALYGSDAMAGVIHYRTPTGKQLDGARLRLEGGSFSTLNGALAAGGTEGDLDWTVSATVNRTGGYPTQTDGLGKRDVGAESRAFSGKLNYQVNDALSLRAVARVSQVDGDTNNAPFASGSLVLDSPGVGYESRNVYYLAGADYEALEGRWTHSLRVQGVDAERTSLSNTAVTSFNESNRLKAQYVTTFHIEGERFNQHITGAVDQEFERYKNGVSGLRKEADNTGYVLDYGVEWNQAGGLGLSVRQDENDLFQNATTYRAQIYHSITDAVRVRAAAGTGIKNPTFFELFGFGATFVGNPDLLPEESRGWEAGADFTLVDGKVQAGFTYFDSTLENEIFSYFGGVLPPGCAAPGPGRNTVCNRPTESTQQGFEVFGKAEIGAGFTVNVSYTDLDAQENGFQEIRRPPQIASVSVNWRSADDRYGLNATARYQGVNQDSNFSILTPAMFNNDPDFRVLPAPPANRVELPSFVLLNLAGDWRINDRFEVFGRVENALDEDYFEVIPYRTSGRAFYAGLRARF